MASINEQIHSKDALVIWDLCHSVGAVPMHLNQTDSDFAIGCTYKYLNGTLVLLHCSGSMKSTVISSGSLYLVGGVIKPFDMAQHYEPANSIRRYLCGTQPVISMSLIECGVDIFLHADMQKSVRNR